ncbi:unnamed protein product, partial [Symbiodinium sp. KB8]
MSGLFPTALIDRFRQGLAATAQEEHPSGAGDSPDAAPERRRVADADELRAQLDAVSRMHHNTTTQQRKLLLFLDKKLPQLPTSSGADPGAQPQRLTMRSISERMELLLKAAGADKPAGGGADSGGEESRVPVQELDLLGLRDGSASEAGGAPSSVRASADSLRAMLEASKLEAATNAAELERAKTDKATAIAKLRTLVDKFKAQAQQLKEAQAALAAERAGQDEAADSTSKATALLEEAEAARRAAEADRADMQARLEAASTARSEAERRSSALKQRAEASERLADQAASARAAVAAELEQVQRRMAELEADSKRGVEGSARAAESALAASRAEAELDDLKAQFDEMRQELTEQIQAQRSSAEAALEASQADAAKAREELEGRVREA